MQIWVAVNKDGFVGLHGKEPKRNKETGRWESGYYICNSILYKEICKLVEHSKLTWENEPQLLEN